MRYSSNNSLCIDVRRNLEVLMLGSLERADAHIPYEAIDMDEWNEFMQAYRNQSNSAFLMRVDDLLLERGLNRSNAVSLIASSYRQGIMAANLLSVAGYGNVVVEVGWRRDSVICSAIIGEKCDATVGGHARYQWRNAAGRQLGGLLH
jgi:rhodanese-related sulfurtransferase